MNQTTETTNAVQTATAKLESLKQSILDGNKTLTPGDLNNAVNELAFCELREEAKKHREEKAIEATRKARLLELQKQLAAVNDSHKTIDAKLESFTKSLHEYLTACATFQNNLNSVRTALREDDLYPESDVIVAGVTPGKTSYGIEIQDRLRTLTIGQTSVTNLAPDDVVKPLVEQALGEFNRNF
jgi:predicted ribosome quality control (RQC) complex YloA/Tae2 family protein